MSVQAGNPGNIIRLAAHSGAAKISAPYRTSMNSGPANAIRRILHKDLTPQIVMQEAPRRYIRSVREAHQSGSYREGVQSRDMVNASYIQSLSSESGALHASGETESGFVLAHLTKLMREHQDYLGGETFASLPWLSASQASQEGSETDAAEHEPRRVETEDVDEPVAVERSDIRQAESPKQDTAPPEPLKAVEAGSADHAQESVQLQAQVQRQAETAGLAGLK